jgi:hypothetical protein
MYIPALFLLLAGRVALVQAHGFVKTWSVDGVSQPGYTPCNPAGVENENTAERATDNKDNGKYRLVLVTDGQVLPIILQQALLAEE